MSEPIQSIAQNNYILHNIDAKKLYVQEPLFTANSGDAVYVGWRPDETVLWSGTGTSGTTLNLSESVKNFNTVKFYGHDSTRNKSMIYEQATNYLTGGETLSFTMQGWDNSIDAHWVGFYYSQLNYTNTAYSALTNIGGNQLYVNTETVGWFKNTGRYIILDKIVGINRKENA